MMIKKFIITDPSFILGSSNNSFKNYKAKAQKQGGEVNGICLVSRKDGGRAKLHRLAISQRQIQNFTNKIDGRTIIVKSGMVCIASTNDGWDNEEYGATFETLEEAIEFFKLTQADLNGELNDFVKTLGNVVRVENRIETVYKPVDSLEIPCYNNECPYAKITNGICTIRISATLNNGEIDIAVKCEDEDELKQKVDCVMNYMYEETGLAGIFKRGG